MSHAPPPISPPDTIAGYTVRAELASGASYLAEGAGGRRVVLKLLEDDCLLDGELHPLIHDRLSRVRELAHVAVANLLGVEPDGERAFLVWEYVEGTPLVEHYPAMDARRRELLARELIACVETLHALGIVHGEIHGNNVFVTPAGHIKLTHVSPLLYNDAQVDTEALIAVLREMGIQIDVKKSASLRELAASVAPSRHDDGTSNSASAAVDSSIDDPRRDRRGSLVAAALVALAAIMIALGVWWWASGLPKPEEFAPVQRTPAAVERGAQS